MHSTDSLSQLLRCWRHSAQPDAAFGPSVWKRIHEADLDDESFALDSRPLWQRLPLAWAAALAMSVGGLTAGTAGYAYTEITHGSRHLVRHVESIDPVQRSASLGSMRAHVHP